MASAPEAVPAGSGLCRFGMQRLPPLLAAFEKEIEGVKAAEDIEFIHRMRVASRRLRAALPLFRTCFPQKQYARWMKEIAGITRALGEARDADVQIAFLVKYRKKSAAAWQARNRTPGGGANPLEPAIAFLHQDLQKRRKQLQLRVLSALDALEKSGIVNEMRTTFSSGIAAGRRTPAQALAYGIPTIAALRIESRLIAMRSFEPWITHADAVAEHHAMRIASKKLRYTMEVYGPIYRLGLKKPHARVKKVQEILGDLHDCDVWIDQIIRLLLRERGRMRSQSGEKRPDTATLASLRLFLQERERERVLLHRHFMRYWESLIRVKIWDELGATLTDGRKKRFVPARKYQEPEIRTAFETLSAGYPEGLAHHRTVARLSLMLFDSLQPLHRLSAHERTLLEAAGMLHDIGWIEGAKRHNARSARRIFSDETLPFDFPDRSAIGLIALSHRGQVRIETHPLFTLLSREYREKVLRLAAIIRVADVLDFLHTGAVQEIHCIIGSRECTFDVVAPGDVAKEKERARSKAGLFSRVFERELVIR